MANIHETDKSRVRNAIRLFRRGNNFGILTDAAVAAANTPLGLRTTVRNASLHEEHTYTKRALVEAINEMEDFGVLTASNVGPLTTFAGLLALLTVEVDSIDNPAKDDGGEHYLGNTPLSEGAIN